MIPRTLLPLTIAALCGSPVRAAPDDAIGGKEWRSAFLDLVKDKDDGRAAEQLGKLAEGFADVPEKDQAECVKALGRVLKVHRDEEELVLHQAVVAALRSMGDDGHKTLKRALRLDPVKDRPPVLATAVASLASFAEKGDLDTMYDHLSHKDSVVQEAAIDGLALFHEDDRMRKDVFDHVLQSYLSVYSQSLPTPPSAREQGQPTRRPDEKRLKDLQDSFEKTLAALSTESQVRGALGWQDWWTDNKRRRWVEDDKG